MRSAGAQPFQDTCAGAHSGVRLHRGLLTSPSASSLAVVLPLEVESPITERQQRLPAACPGALDPAPCSGPSRPSPRGRVKHAALTAPARDDGCECGPGRKDEPGREPHDVGPAALPLSARLRAGPSRAPYVMISVCPSGCVCQFDFALGSKATWPPLRRDVRRQRPACFPLGEILGPLGPRVATRRGAPSSQADLMRPFSF